MITLKDVAQKANVSQMTVSRVLNHPDAVSTELSTLVFAAMEELDYHPNIMAKALANNKTHVIKVFILEDMAHTEPYYMRVLNGITQILNKQHYFLQLTDRNEQTSSDCDGVVIMGAKTSDLSYLKSIKKPLVVFGEDQIFDFVDTDNEQDTFKATLYADKCGYDQLYYLGLDRQEPFAKKRQAGYLQAIHLLQKKAFIFTPKNNDYSHLKKLHFQKTALSSVQQTELSLKLATLLQNMVRYQKILASLDMIRSC